MRKILLRSIELMTKVISGDNIHMCIGVSQVTILANSFRFIFFNYTDQHTNSSERNINLHDIANALASGN